MTTTRIIENDDDSMILVTEPDSPMILAVNPERTTVSPVPSDSFILPIINGRGVVSVEQDTAQVIQATGAGGAFRGVVNFDGGLPHTEYGDLLHLDGGGITEPFYYPL